MDLLNNISAFLLTKTTPYAAIKNTVFPGASSEEIIIRADPSSAVIDRYLDGTFAGEQSFSFLTKSKNQTTARNQLETFCSVLDLSSMQQITGALFGKIEVAGRPVLVSYNDAKEYVFSASFLIEFYTVKED